MTNLNVIKAIVIVLHGLMLVFALFVFLGLTNGDVISTLQLSATEPNLRKAIWLSGFVMGGNMLGILLPVTPLYRSFIGSCVLAGYEIIFLAVSIQLLSTDYSVVIAVTICAYLYVISVRSSQSNA